MNITPEMRVKAQESRQKAKEAKKLLKTTWSATPQQVRTIDGIKKSLSPESSTILLMEKCYRGSASASQCIKGKCLECTNFQRNEVMLCGITSCPLWLRRPFQEKQ